MAKKKSTTQSRKKVQAKKKPTRRKAVKRPVQKPAKASTVDGVLKSFEKERVTLNTDLIASRKKIETLTDKIARMKTELENTKRKIVESETAIETLDARRDREIGVLLLDMGVDLARAAAAAKPKVVVDQGTPLFDEDSSQEDDAGESVHPLNSAKCPFGRVGHESGPGRVNFLKTQCSAEGTALSPSKSLIRRLDPSQREGDVCT